MPASRCPADHRARACRSYTRRESLSQGALFCWNCRYDLGVARFAMAGVPTVKARAQVRVDEERSMGESESVALVGPGARDALKQQLDGQSPGPATFGDGLDD